MEKDTLLNLNIESIPKSPGIYLFKDSKGKILYIGKAKELRKRLSYYLKGDLSYKTLLMLKKAYEIEYIITNTENEAFLLERNLIKQYMPRYNVVLRDDKQYPSLRLDPTDPYPRLEVVRKIKKDGAIYFGPFSSSSALRSTLCFIDKTFRLRKCRQKRPPKRARPCINYQLNRCLAPCVNQISPSQYAEIVKEVRLFFEGKRKELIEELRIKMKEASESLEFERAALIRDQIRAIERTVQRQSVTASKLNNADIIGIRGADDTFLIYMLFIRGGSILGSRHYRLKAKGSSEREVLESFIKQFYLQDVFISPHILISEPLEETDAIERWLSEVSGRSVKIENPKRGIKFSMVEMAKENAKELLFSAKKEISLLELLQKRLSLRSYPRKIEVVDISNLFGTEAVGSTVCFVDGKEWKKGYRNYRIKEVENIDDYSMIKEVLRRRLRKGELPDLFIIDGGKGHLSVAEDVIDEMALKDQIELISIAKADKSRGEKLDKIYILGKEKSIEFSETDPVLLFIMKMRDEAHRRAITYHKKLRFKAFKMSALDTIKGLGPKKKAELLKKFGSIEAIRNASVLEIMQVKGIGKRLAGEILSSLKGLSA